MPTLALNINTELWGAIAGHAGAVLSKLAEPIIHKMNEHEAESFLAKVKTRMEG